MEQQHNVIVPQANITTQRHKTTSQHSIKTQHHKTASLHNVTTINFKLYSVDKTLQPAKCQKNRRSEVHNGTISSHVEILNLELLSYCQ